MAISLHFHKFTNNITKDTSVVAFKYKGNFLIHYSVSKYYVTNNNYRYVRHNATLITILTIILRLNIKIYLFFADLNSHT